MTKKLIAGAVVVALLAVGSVQADIIDLSGAATGTTITAPGGSFAGLFAGQSLSGTTGISGSPTPPLTLQAANNLTVAPWGGTNSILPDPDNQGPLSVLLDTAATSISWTMGSAQPPSSVKIDFFANDGSLVNSLSQSLLSGYNVYSYNGFGSFSGLSIYNNVDLAGLRFQNFEYVPVPVPSAVLLGILGLSAAGRKLRRRKVT